MTDSKVSEEEKFNVHPLWMLARVQEELGMLAGFLNRGDVSVQQVRKQAQDIAEVAMMVADAYETQFTAKPAQKSSTVDAAKAIARERELMKSLRRVTVNLVGLATADHPDRSGWVRCRICALGWDAKARPVGVHSESCPIAEALGLLERAALAEPLGPTHESRSG